MTSTKEATASTRMERQEDLHSALQLVVSNTSRQLMDQADNNDQPQVDTVAWSSARSTTAIAMGHSTHQASIQTS